MERPLLTPRFVISCKVDLDGRRSHLPTIDGTRLASADGSLFLGWFCILYLPCRFSLGLEVVGLETAVLPLLLKFASQDII